MSRDGARFAHCANSGIITGDDRDGGS